MPAGVGGGGQRVGKGLGGRDRGGGGHLADRLAVAVPQGVNPLDRAERSLADVFCGVDERRIGALLGAGLHDPVVLAGGLDGFAALPDAVADRFLDVNILASLTGHDGEERVPVVGRGDHDDVHVRPVQDMAKILMLPVAGIDVGALLVQRVFELVLGAVHVGLVGVADGHDPDPRLGGEIAQVAGALAAAADDGHPDIRVGAQHTVGGQGQHGARGQ